MFLKYLFSFFRMNKKKKIYLDYASTAPMLKVLIKDSNIIMNNYYKNIDSLYPSSKYILNLVEKSKKIIANYFNVLPNEIIFTSGASESNSAAIKGIVFANKKIGKHIITTKIEHSSVIYACKQLSKYFNYNVEYLPVNKNGVLEVSVLKKALKKDTVLVTFMSVNNEIGSVLNVKKLVNCVKKYSKAFVHIDGVQSLAKKDFSMKQVDSAAFSAHKIFGLKGSGLWIKRSNVRALPLINGKLEKINNRGGTIDNLSSILWGKNLLLASKINKKYKKYLLKLKKILDFAFRNKEKKGIIVNSPLNAIPHIYNISILGIKSEIMLNYLYNFGYEISAKATCYKNIKEPSRVLKAIGKNYNISSSSIRISISHFTKKKDIFELINKILEAKKKFSKI